jgi:ADP-ribosylglycohydrolase
MDKTLYGQTSMQSPQSRRTPDHFKGCLLGGAAGDALGYTVEFQSLEEIRRSYGQDGIQHYPATGGIISDDTQMTLFTAEGLLRAKTRWSHKGIVHIQSVVHRAYIRWLYTQGESPTVAGLSQGKPYQGWLIEIKEFHVRRAPGLTCLAALRSTPLGHNAVNDSKGCGGVMRVAPCGLFFDSERAFKIGCEAAAITHGHPTGILSSGFLAMVIALLVEGVSLLAAIQTTCQYLQAASTEYGETLTAVKKAVEYASSKEASAETVQELGAGWVAEEALAIGLYCALVAGEDFRAAVRLAVNHSGDSDSTGAIAGTLVGLLIGEKCIPAEYLEGLELADVIREVAQDLYRNFEEGEAWWNKYPGS